MMRHVWRLTLTTTRAVAVFLGVLVISVAMACTDATIEPLRVSTIGISPPTATVQAGGTVALVAQPKDGDGLAVVITDITWSSSNTAVATVSTSGIVTAFTAGDVQIAASAQGRSATAVITVAARAVATVVVSPATVSMRTGQSAPLQVQTLDADGKSLTGRVVTWQSSNSAVVAVSSDGTVTGIAVGAATITATSEGRTGQVAVTVTLPPVQTIVVTPALDTLGVGTERALNAVLRDASNQILSDRALLWSSNNLAVATVSSTGVVTGAAPGTATISASSEGRVGTATVVVLARLADAVTLTPASTTLIAGSAVQLVAQVTDPVGNLLAGRPITYATNAGTVATVSATGNVTAVAPGTARITAVSEGKSGVSIIQVIAVPVTTVEVTPIVVTLVPSAQRQFGVVARAANGTVVSGRPTTWTSGSTGIVTVTNAGLVSAVAPGVAIVLVAVDGVISYSTVTVSPAAVAMIQLAPLDPHIDVGSTVQMVATFRDAQGAILTGRHVVWKSDDESVAFVSSNGLVLGLKVGSTAITVTSGGVSASTRITVR